MVVSSLFMFKSQTCATQRVQTKYQCLWETKCIHCLLQSRTCVAVTTSRDLNAARNAPKAKGTLAHSHQSVEFHLQLLRQQKRRRRSLHPSAGTSSNLSGDGWRLLRCICCAEVVFCCDRIRRECNVLLFTMNGDKRRLTKMFQNPMFLLTLPVFQYASFCLHFFFLNTHLLPT